MVLVEAHSWHATCRCPTHFFHIENKYPLDDQQRYIASRKPVPKQPGSSLIPNCPKMIHFGAPQRVSRPPGRRRDPPDINLHQKSAPKTEGVGRLSLWHQNGLDLTSGCPPPFAFLAGPGFLVFPSLPFLQQHGVLEKAHSDQCDP